MQLRCGSETAGSVSAPDFTYCLLSLGCPPVVARRHSAPQVILVCIQWTYRLSPNL